MDCLIITGFMGTGKTTVARQVANLLGWGWVDLDQVIEARTGMSIQQYFERYGEPAFRALERHVLEETLGRSHLVVSTGGGTLMGPGAMALARRHGWVASLTAALDELQQRIGNGRGRPLAMAGAEALAQLLEVRTPIYAQADVMIDTSVRTPEDVAREVFARFQATVGLGKLEQLMSTSPDATPEATLRVPLGERRYDLVFQPGGRKALGEHLKKLFPSLRRTVVITNPRVNALYGADVLAGLEAHGLVVHVIEVPDSEEAKQLSEVARVLDALLALKLERREPIIALGGGVVGDLVGFVASIYLRGIPFVQVPTTLLAQVDSSIGGKTGVNSPRGKNLIGSFYQPSLVMMDVEVLQTLDDGDFRAGLAEVVKYGFIRDRAFLEFLIREAQAVRMREPEALQKVVFRSCVNKAQVVVRDEREQGERALLNFGHTLGHAFETLAMYHGLKHGLAVAIGMRFAARLSEARKIAPEGLSAEVDRLLERFDLKLPAPDCSVEQCLEVMTLDKKVSQGTVKFIVLEATGQARIEALRFEELRETLEAFLAESCLERESAQA